MSGGAYGIAVPRMDFSNLANLGKTWDDAVDGVIRARQEAEAPALLDKLMGAQAAPAPVAGVGAGAGVGAPAAPVSRSLPAFARAQGALPSEKIQGLINDVATRTDIHPGYFPRLVDIESKGDPNAFNKGSGASGLTQFIPSTAKAYGLADPFDAAANLDAARRLTLDNRDMLRQRLGREPTPGELYLGHQQGAAGAARLLANPDLPAARLVGARAVVANGGTPDMSARDFARVWTSRFDDLAPQMAPAAVRAAAQPAPAAQPAAPTIPFAPGNRTMTMPDAAPGATMPAPALPAPSAPAPMTPAQAAADDEADKPVPNARPAGFVIPPGGVQAPAAPAQPEGFAGFGTRAQRMTPEYQEVLRQAWKNPVTRGVATQIYGQLLKGADSSWSIADLGHGRKVFFDSKTGRTVPIDGTGDQFVDETDAAGNIFSRNTLTNERRLLKGAKEAKEEGPYTLKPGDVRFGADNQQVAAVPKPEADTMGVPPGVDPTTYRKELAKATVAEEKGATQRAQQASSALPMLERAERAYQSLADANAIGPYQASGFNRTIGGMFGAKIEQDRQEYEAAAKELELLKAQVSMKGQGAITEGERRILALTLPRLDAASGETGLATLRTMREQLGRTMSAPGLSTRPATGPAPRLGSVDIPMAEAQALRADTDTADRRAAFDAKYGEGASLQVLKRPLAQGAGAQGQGQGSAPPVAGARIAPDGRWYVADPQRPGKYLQVQL